MTTGSSLRLAVLAVAAGLLVGCGSGAVENPEADEPGRPNGNHTTRPDDPDEPERYGWTPPKGDESVQATFGTAINLVHAGDCDGADAFLDQGEPPNWQNLTSPRNVLLLEAAIALCRDDEQTAEDWYRQAGALGWAGSQDANTCPLYQAVASVVEQRPPDDFSCLDGQAAEYQYNPDTDRMDDPRTPENEAAAPPPDTASPEPTVDE